MTLYFDLFMWMEVGQTLQPFATVMGVLFQGACGRYGLKEFIISDDKEKKEKRPTA